MPREEPLEKAPLDAQRPFAREDVYRRVARTAQLEKGSRILELSAGAQSGALWLALSMGCDGTVCVEDDETASALTKASGALGNRFTVRKGSFASAGLPKNEFNAILVFARRQAPLEGLVSALRPLLALNGRLCIGYPVKVGITPHAEQVGHWEKELKEPLRQPKELLGALVNAGFEPEWVETLSSSELDALYRAKTEAEPAFAKDPENTLHRQHGGRAGVTYGFAVARRREPGERPPKSRDRG